MKRPQRRQAGDTIVEVMISMAVASMIIGSCYAVVNRTMQNTRQAQEHAEALQIAVAQVEAIKANKEPIALNPVFNEEDVDVVVTPVPGGPVKPCIRGVAACDSDDRMLNRGTETTFARGGGGCNGVIGCDANTSQIFCYDTSTGNFVNSTVTSLPAPEGGYAAACKGLGANDMYRVGVDYDDDNKAYVVYVNWPSVTGNGDDQVNLRYRP